jgi:hypothetical protein
MLMDITFVVSSRRAMTADRDCTAQSLTMARAAGLARRRTQQPSWSLWENWPASRGILAVGVMGTTMGLPGSVIRT